MNPPPPSFPRRRDWLLLAIGVGFILVFMLGSRGLNEPDEGRYANIAQAMAAPGGSWWEPRLSGFGHYDKPPLVYWATALSFRAFGLNEWAARLPSLLGALLALAGLGWAAYRLRGAAVAWWAILICGTFVQFWTMGRILSPDMLLTGWCTLAVAAWAECRHRAGGWTFWWVSLLCWTLAWWTKATAALVPLAGLALGVIVSRDLPGRRAMRLPFLLPAILLLGSPWYVSMLGRYPELRRFFLGRELVGRLAGRVDGRHGSILYYLPVSLAGWLPWWPVVTWRSWRARHSSAGGADAGTPWIVRIGVEGWIVLVGLLVFSFVGSKLPTYTLTVAPWVALIMARVLVTSPANLPARPSLATLAPAGIFAVVALTCVVVLPRRYESRLGVNSSLRQVCRFLQQQQAARVDVDHYWPSTEFYLGANTVHYMLYLDAPPPEMSDTGKSDARSSGESPDSVAADPPKIEKLHERTSDPGVPPARFIDPPVWSTLSPEQVAARSTRSGGWWFVRFHGRQKPLFDVLLTEPDPSRRPVKVARVGGFDVYRMPDHS